jgi:allophanate hydrolase subunit 2
MIPSHSPTMDLNSDVGESYGRWRLGDDAPLLEVVTNANVACGFHARRNVLSGLGPAVLTAGSLLPIGRPPTATRKPDHGALELLDRTPWTVTAESDRVGMRLAGADLPRSTSAELPSAGVVRDALQVARSAPVRPGQCLQFTHVPDHARGAS